MNWLFWKEYRQNRVVVIALLVTLVLPHLFGIYGMWYDWRRANMMGLPWEQLLEDWKKMLLYASYFSLAISQLALALIGGNAIASERADRSAEFQVYLPLTRKRILAAKLLLVSAIAAVIWLTNPVIMWSTIALANRTVVELYEWFIAMLIIATTGLTFFCVAWFFSAILRSPTFCVAAGLVTPLILWGLVMYGNYLIQGNQWKPGTDMLLVIWYICSCLAAALPSFGFGTWLYLRRVEP